MMGNEFHCESGNESDDDEIADDDLREMYLDAAKRAQRRGDMAKAAHWTKVAEDVGNDESEADDEQELVTDGGVETLASIESERTLNDYTDLGGLDTLDIDDVDAEAVQECDAKHCSQNAEYIVKETETSKLPFGETSVRCKRHAKRSKIRGFEILAFDGTENLCTDPWRSD